MRIIAGERRGHKIESPRDKSTRPTSDLVREAIFNILGGSVVGARAIDLFAGSGALGLEALSRGAKKALFVERNRDNGALIERNLATLRYEDRGSVLVSDAFRWAHRHRVLEFGGEPTLPAVVFLDPPYREYVNHPGRMTRLLEALLGRLPEGSAIVVEFDSGRDAEILESPSDWEIRKYGSTSVAIRWVVSMGVDAEPPEMSVSIGAPVVETLEIESRVFDQAHR